MQCIEEKGDALHEYQQQLLMHMEELNVINREKGLPLIRAEVKTIKTSGDWDRDVKLSYGKK